MPFYVCTYKSSKDINSSCNKSKRYKVPWNTFFFFDILKSHQLSSLRGLPGRQISTMHECIMYFLLGKGWDFSTFAIFQIHREGWKMVKICPAWRGNLHFTMAWRQKTVPLLGMQVISTWKSVWTLENMKVLPSQVMQVSAPTISKKYHKWYTWYQNALQTY